MVRAAQSAQVLVDGLQRTALDRARDDGPKVARAVEQRELCRREGMLDRRLLGLTTGEDDGLELGLVEAVQVGVRLERRLQPRVLRLGELALPDDAVCGTQPVSANKFRFVKQCARRHSLLSATTSSTSL